MDATTGRLVRKLRLRHLELLAVLAEADTMRSASAQLHLSQPAISKMLGEIEACFGARLFERSHQGIHPNALGASAVFHARAVLNQLARATEDVGAMQQGDAAPPEQRRDRLRRGLEQRQCRLVAGAIQGGKTQDQARPPRIVMDGANRVFARILAGGIGGQMRRPRRQGGNGDEGRVRRTPPRRLGHAPCAVPVHAQEFAFVSRRRQARQMDDRIGIFAKRFQRRAVLQIAAHDLCTQAVPGGRRVGPAGEEPKPDAFLRQRRDQMHAQEARRTGDGDGTVVKRGFPAPPSFHIPRLVAAPPAYVVGVITNGHGVMYSYADRVAPADRWAIAAYVKTLQRARQDEGAAR